MIRRISKIGVAVRDLEQATSHFVSRLGAVSSPIQRFEPYGMEYSMCRVGNVDFELMAPLGKGGAIARFLDSFGEGLQHVGFAVDDAAATQAELTARGLDFVDDAPQCHVYCGTDFGGTHFDDHGHFTFIRPSSLHGVLLELIQYPPGFAWTRGILPARRGEGAGSTILGITEVGVAVRDLEQATSHFVSRLDAVSGPIQRYEPYGLEYCMCRVGNVDFELMAPLGKGGVIAEFLERFGEGLHHIGFAVGDAATTQAKLTARGLGFINDAPQRQRFCGIDFSGAPFDDDCRFTFSRPSSLAGVLLEFIQYPPGFALEDDVAPV